MNVIEQCLQNDFPDYFQTITQLSKDISQQHYTNLFCISKTKLFNFESFCQNILSVRDYSLVDALSFTNDSLIFIEFKSGSNIKSSEVRLKITDSQILLFKAIQDHLQSLNIPCDAYKNMKKIYVVVFDTTKNTAQRTSAIRCHLTQLSVRFNLEFYDQCYLTKVHTPDCSTQFRKVMNHYGVTI